MGIVSIKHPMNIPIRNTSNTSNKSGASQKSTISNNSINSNPY